MLADKDTKRFPSKKLTNDLYNLINRWKKNNYIDELTYKRLRTTDEILGVQLCFRRFPIDGFSGK